MHSGQGSHQTCVAAPSRDTAQYVLLPDRHPGCTATTLTSSLAYKVCSTQHCRHTAATLVQHFPLAGRCRPHTASPKLQALLPTASSTSAAFPRANRCHTQHCRSHAAGTAAHCYQQCHSVAKPNAPQLQVLFYNSYAVALQKVHAAAQLHLHWPSGRVCPPTQPQVQQ